MTDLGTLGGPRSSAGAINSSGQIVGMSLTTSSGIYHAFLYSDGRMVDLDAGHTTSDSAGVDINDSEQIVGIWLSTAAPSTGHAFLYSDGHMTDLGTLSGFYSSAAAINSSGQIVGMASLSSGGYHAFLYSDGHMTDLNSLLPPNSGWVLTDARAINDSGQIVGSGTINGQTHVFLMTITMHGVDLSAVPTATEWFNLIDNFNPRFVIADAWGGDSPFQAQQILSTAPSSLKKAAYVLLNYDDPSQPGATQVGYALNALGSEYRPANLAFMAVDVEPICHQNANGVCVNPEYLPTDPVSIASRVQRIYDAVQAVERAGLNPVIYASQNNWAIIAGNTHPSFGCLPLWTPRYDGSDDLNLRVPNSSALGSLGLGNLHGQS